MPRYLNSNNFPVEVQGIRIEPGEIVTSVVNIAKYPSGVTFVDDVGYFDPIISSASITNTTTVNVPSTVLNNYQIEIFCSSGSVSVQYNTYLAKAQVLNVGDRINLFCQERIVANIIVTISSGTCTVTIKRA